MNLVALQEDDEHLGSERTRLDYICQSYLGQGDLRSRALWARAIREQGVATTNGFGRIQTSPPRPGNWPGAAARTFPRRCPRGFSEEDGRWRSAELKPQARLQASVDPENQHLPAVKDAHAKATRRESHCKRKRASAEKLACRLRENPPFRWRFELWKRRDTEISEAPISTQTKQVPNLRRCAF